MRKVHTGGYPVGHVGWNASSPDALHIALGQGLAERVDGLDREFVKFELTDTEELVAVQAVNGTHCKSGKCIRAAIQRFRAWEGRCT
jgi:hypothetical protein